MMDECIISISLKAKIIGAARSCPRFTATSLFSFDQPGF
ncbi:hypothetical protein MTY_0542 [Moorella thermoacetica Y72]|uniref:Uncharacterized protein n=1 Tax=Moorella thermoacetica Y72 TaxID=1325331 RepID=A0A0S6UCA9_NEOTH|nr:hypothetical protein MTY_0542 [Moorella thermoacetica Y72]